MERTGSLLPPPSVPGVAGIFPALRALETMADQDPDFMPARPLLPGRAAHRVLMSAGHIASRFLTACDLMARKGCLHALGEALPVLRAAREAGVALPAEDGLFACPLVASPQGWTLQPVVLPASLTRRLLPVWRRVQPDLSRRLPPVLPVPVAIHEAPLWPALLRLRPLRPQWERHLRRSHVAALLRLLPDAWFLDPTPLPPGAVIPRLEIHAWEDLPRLRPAGRSYLLSPATAAGSGTVLDAASPAGLWQTPLREALLAPPADRHVLTALPPEGAVILCAMYQQEGRRVRFLGAFGSRAGNHGARETFRTG